MAKDKELVPAETKELALANLAMEDMGAGMEGADKDCFAIPFLRVLQQLSPQCIEGKPDFIPGAKPGMLFNTITNHLYDGKAGIIFVPCAFERIFIRWGPRGTPQGGYKGAYRPEEVELMRERGELTESDNRLFFGEPNPKKSDQCSDTRNHFGLIMEEGGATQVLLSLSSSQIKRSKQMLGLLGAVRVNGQCPPTWMNKIRITTGPESNDQGDWWGIRVEQAGLIDSADLYAMGKAFHKTIAAGAVKVDYQQAEEVPPAQEKF